MYMQAARSVCQSRRVGKDIKNSWANLVRVVDTGIDAAFQGIAGLVPPPTPHPRARQPSRFFCFNQFSTKSGGVWNGSDIQKQNTKNNPGTRACRPGFFNDFDMLEVGSSDGNMVGDPTMTETEQRAHFSLWAALKSPSLPGSPNVGHSRSHTERSHS